MTQADPLTAPTDQIDAGDAAGVARPAPRPLTSAEREMQELLELAKKLSIDGDDDESAQPDADAAQAVAELGLDQPVEVEETPVAAFLAADDLEPETDDDSVAAVFQTEGAAWFAVNTYTQKEKKVRESLNLRIRNMDVSHQFVPLDRQLIPEKDRDGEDQYVLIPTQKEVKIRRGKREEVPVELLPGYVLIQIRIDPRSGQPSDQSWHVVKDTTYVTGFVGSEEEARPLPAGDVAAIIGQTQQDEVRVNVGFKVDDSVRVIEGPFQDFVAKVEQINLEKGKVRVLISMFGRETPVDLDFEQVVKE